MILLLGSFTTISSELSFFEGSMVGRYGCFVSETINLEHTNVVNLTLSIGVNGVNTESPYYNCGLTERMARIRCQIPVQNHEEIRQMDRPTMYSNLSDDDWDHYSQWYIFLLIWLVTFTITLRSQNTEVVFTLEAETDIIDLSTNSSEITTVSESASFNYLVQSHYTSTLAQDLMTVGIYLIGAGSIAVIIVMVVKLIPKKPG